MPGGGWNCRRARGATPSSMHTTFSAFEGLREYELASVFVAGRFGFAVKMERAEAGGVSMRGFSFRRLGIGRRPHRGGASTLGFDAERARRRAHRRSTIPTRWRHRH